MAASPWTFTQLGGEKKSLTLAGWAAPFGRPRKGAVVEEELHVRHSETRYQENVTPTRHDFGMDFEPWTLHGRWMDHDLGPGGANTRALAWKKFVTDRQRVAVRWGDIVAYKGFLTKLKLGRESNADIAWQLEVKLDEDEDLTQTLRKEFNPSAKKLADQTEALLGAWLSQLPTPSNLGVSVSDAFAMLREDVLDALDNLVTAVNTPSAQLLETLRSIESFDQAVVAELERVRYGAGQTKTAVLELQETLQTNRTDAILYTRTGDGDITWGARKADADAASVALLAVLADLGLHAEIAQRERATSSVVAQMNDTWESMSVAAYGGPDQADVIRQANGVRFGEKPEPGRSYILPRK